MADLCLTLICPRAIEERLLDTLLATPGADVFSSTEVRSHGMPAGRLSAEEQVMGRSRSVQVQVLLAQGEADALIGVLRSEFASGGLRFWALPLAMEGEIA